MTKPHRDIFEMAALSKHDASLARESSRRLAKHRVGRRSPVRIRLLNDAEKAETITVPASALRLFQHLLMEMAEGNTVTLIPHYSELTTQQAAELLNVSRPYLAKLLDGGRIPSRSVGRYRRVRLHDLMAYKRKDDASRAKILDQLTAEAQELGMGY
jgi:excisionase family DNA binding protein